MNKRIDKLLQDMRLRPGVYFGTSTPSIKALSDTLAGYIWCLSEETGEPASYFNEFQEFIQKHYDIHSMQHWSDIIRFFCTSDVEAFHTFFELYDEFKKQEEHKGTVS